MEQDKFEKSLKIKDIVNLVNISEKLSEEDLTKIGRKVVEGFERDKESRTEWESKVADAMKLAKLERETKNTPFRGASNVKFPLITSASIQFAARTYPEIVRNGKVVEVAVVGADPDGQKEQRAKRLAAHMSYQLLIENNEWEEHTDKLLHMLPIIGTCFKKTWYDPIKELNHSETLLPECVIINDNVKSLDEARRVTHCFRYHTNDLLERMRSGIYSTISVDELCGKEDNFDGDKWHEVLEQHRWLDLGNDGYEEPYIVTVHKETSKVLRIVSRFNSKDVVYNSKEEVVKIIPSQYFTDFHFLPSPDGKFHSFGYGLLLLDLNETVNTILNQLIDAGKLANTQCGIIGKGLRIPGGAMEFQPGEFKKAEAAAGTDIASNVYQFQFKEPSNVLFQLLGLLIDTTKELSSVTDALQGSEQVQNVPATTILAMIREGLRVFSSIQRRLYRSFKREFEKLYRLNRVFLDPIVYMKVMDEQQAVLQQDYEDESLDVFPVSDPNLSSDAQRMARAQAGLSLIGQPGVVTYEILKEYMETLQFPNIEKKLPPPSPNPEPTIQEQEILAKIEQGARKIEIMEEEHRLDKERFLVEIEKAQAQIVSLKAQSIRAIAEAEAREAGIQIDTYTAQVDALAPKLGAESKEGAINPPNAPRGPETMPNMAQQMESEQMGMPQSPQDMGNTGNMGGMNE